MKDNHSFPKKSFSSNNSPPSTILEKGNNTHFQLYNLYREFEQDESALKEFIQVVESDLIRLSRALIAAFRQNDVSLYQQMHYRTLTPLKMIQANTLQRLLAEGSDLMIKEEATTETATFSKLEREFSAVLTSLAELT